jgi:hypothetical protein
MRRHLPPDGDGGLTRLIGKVDRLEHAVADLATLRADVEAHSRSLTDLATAIRVTRAPDPHGEPAGANADLSAEATPGVPTGDDPAPDWISVTDPSQAIAWLDGLDVWVRQVWTRYGRIPPCWPWHPDVVAELLVCAHVWAGAVLPGNGPELLAAWHDRWRPGTAHRVNRALTGCERTDGEHLAGPGPRWAIDLTVLDEIAHWWATTHGASLAPGLTKSSYR